MTFTIVLFGWIFSLCLHEFSHALVAYNGGDYTVQEKGYLTFNPFKYTHPYFPLSCLSSFYCWAALVCRAARSTSRRGASATATG